MNRRASPYAQVLLIGAFLIFNVWTVYAFFTTQFPGATDFYSKWRGARAFWVEGKDPYSAEVTRQIEIEIYGKPYVQDPYSGMYRGDFLYLFSTAILLAPLAVLPYDLASAIWLVLTGAFVAAAYAAMIDVFNWRMRRWLYLFGLVWAVTFYPAARGLFLGQMGTVTACLELLTLWALARSQDRLAGILLAVSTFKPTLGILIVPFLFLWGIRFGRWRFVGAFLAALAVLTGVSFMLLPGWAGGWLSQVLGYSEWTEIGSPVWILTSLAFPFLGQPVELGLTLALLGLVLWSWWQTLWRRDSSKVIWAAALCLTVTHLVLLRTATPHYVVFFLVLVPCFRGIALAGRRGPLLAALFMLVLSAALWALFLATLVNRFEHAVNYLPLPISALVLLLIARRQWWQSTPGLPAESPLQAMQPASQAAGG